MPMSLGNARQIWKDKAPRSIVPMVKLLGMAFRTQSRAGDSPQNWRIEDKSVIQAFERWEEDEEFKVFITSFITI